MYDKEEIYDREISPLMAQIVEICKRENLPMVAQFYLKQQHEDADVENEAMYCSTVIIPERTEIYEDHYEHLSYVAHAMRYGKNETPWVLTTKITK